MTISPELLAAYADGELDGGAARTVEAAIDSDPQLQAHLAAHRALQARLTAHFAPITQLPIPDRLQQAVMADEEASKVIDFAEHAQRRAPVIPARWARIVGPALAASLILALIGFSLRPADNSYARGDVALALDSQLVATQAAAAPVRILLSFQDKDGQYCRGFTEASHAGIACHDDRGWHVLKTFDGNKSGATEYRQAGSPDVAAMAEIQAMATGAALDATEEQQAARTGWRVRRPH